MSVDAKVDRLVQKVSDLEVRRAVSDAVTARLCGFLLASQAVVDPAQMLAGLRQMAVVVQANDMSALGAENDVHVTQLKAEQYLQDLVDSIERVLPKLR